MVLFYQIFFDISKYSSADRLQHAAVCAGQGAGVLREEDRSIQRRVRDHAGLQRGLPVGGRPGLQGHIR